MKFPLRFQGVRFKEDASLANIGNAYENIASLRRLSMNIIKTFIRNEEWLMQNVTQCWIPHIYEDYCRGCLQKVVKNF